MATRNEQFFIDLGKGASWAAGVAFQRSNPLPLDKYSVFETEAKAIEYASTSAVAYPGQVVAYVAGEKMAVCVLAENADGSSLELQPIGGAIGDYETAQPNTLPQKKAVYDEDGETVIGYEVKWLPVSAIVEGDGNTTYTFAKKANDDKTLVITPYDEGVAGETTEISFAYLTADEVNNAIDAKVGVPVNGEEAATGLYALLDAEIARAKEAEETLDAKIGAASTETTEASGVYAAIEAAEEALTEAIANALEEAKQYADDNDANDNTTYAISYGEYEIDGTTKKAIKLAGSDNSATYVDVADFLKDGMVDTVSLSDDGKSLVIVWNTDAGKETTEIPLEGFIDVYTAGNGIDITGRVVSAKLDTTTENFLTVGENGIKLAGVQDAINTAKQGAIDTAAGDATSKANQAKADAIADAEEKLAAAVETINDAIDLKANAADVYAKTETFTKEEINGLVEGATNVASTAIAGVQTALDEYIEANDEVVGGHTTSIGTINETLATKANSADVYAKTETYTQGEINTAIANAISPLATKESLAATDKNITDLTGRVSTNETNISGLQGTASSQGERIGALETLTNDYATVKGNAADAVSRVSAVETRLDNAEGKIGGLETLTGTHTSDIAALKAKDTALDGDIAGINVTLGTKANASDLNNYYTKSEVGTIAEGKTLVKMIEEAGDKSALEARVKANEDAIVGINEDIADINEAIKAIDYVDEDELAAAIKAETDRAVAEEERLAGLISDNADAIAENAKAIAGNTAAINSILGNEDETDLNSIAELAKWIEDHGEEAAGMAEAIEANTVAIGVNAEGVAANKAAAETNATAIKTINETTIPAAITEAKEYTDDQIEALNMASYKVKDVDGTTLQVSDAGVASIKAVSSDLWAQGTEEIIFNGGGAVL